MGPEAHNLSGWGATPHSATIQRSSSMGEQLAYNQKTGVRFLSPLPEEGMWT